MDREYIRHTRIPGSVIILHLLLFPFTGIYLLIRRIAKPDYMINYKAAKVCGWIFITIAIIFSISQARLGLGFQTTFWICYGIPGIYTLYRAKRIYKYGKKHEMDNVPVVDYVKNDAIDNVQINNEYTFNYTTPKPTKYKVVTCSSCGAKKKIADGSVDRCEFCDMPLG